MLQKSHTNTKIKEASMHSQKPIWTCVVCAKTLNYTIDKSFHLCKKHQKQTISPEQKIEFQKEIKANNCIKTRNSIVCPNCFNVHNMVWDEIEIKDKNSDLVECRHCETKFLVTVSKVYEQEKIIGYDFTSELGG